jgi:hypothetical protein
MKRGAIILFDNCRLSLPVGFLVVLRYHTHPTAQMRGGIAAGNDQRKSPDKNNDPVLRTYQLTIGEVSCSFPGRF